MPRPWKKRHIVSAEDSHIITLKKLIKVSGSQFFAAADREGEYGVKVHYDDRNRLTIGL